MICLSHWLLMSAWLVQQQTTVCGSRCEDILFSMVLGLVYIFTYITAKDGQTRYNYFLYYLICFIENTGMVIVWCISANSEIWFFYPAVITQMVCFFFGVAFMVLYYRYFHPTRRTKCVFRRHIVVLQSNGDIAVKLEPVVAEEVSAQQPV